MQKQKTLCLCMYVCLFVCLYVCKVQICMPIRVFFLATLSETRKIIYLKKKNMTHCMSFRSWRLLISNQILSQILV